VSDDVIIDGQRVLPAEEAAAELGLSVEEVRRHGQEASFPRVCTPPGTFYGLKRSDVEVWRRMLTPVKVEPQAVVRSASLVNGVYVEDQDGDG
jgi:hypothetical protein